MSPSPTDDDDARALFLQATAGAKKLRQDTIAPPTARPRPPQAAPAAAPSTPPAFFFSDDYQPLLGVDGSYHRHDAPAELLSRVRRGLLPASLLLDLHGLSRDECKAELAALLDAGVRQQHDCLLVICGRGLGILKEKVPAYLAQHPAVVAVLPAPRAQGGKYAYLVLVEHAESQWR